ncbi:MAG: cupin domain-containing protein [Spirochaetes bacterium]|nr:cupin domain-containing protein [Spirochaetota bacterium]
MKIFEYSKIKPTMFDNEEMKSVAGRVIIGKNDGAKNFCMRIFEIAPGGFTRKHTHEWEHEMFVHAGKGEFLGNGKWNSAKAGDAVFVPMNEEHQIRNTGEDLLVVICLVPSNAPEL